MNENTTAVAVAQPLQAVRIGERGLVLNDLESLWRFSGYVASSGLAPKGITTREAIFVAVQMGLEVGLTPMAALQNIAVINGRPSIWGDAQLGIVRGTGQLESFEEWFEQGGKRLPRNPTTFPDDTVAVIRVKRAGYPAAETGFSVLDAKAAGLWGKEGPWKQYPYRMLKFRARSFALRDLFGDALKGIMSTEEAQDLPMKEAKVTAAPTFLKAPEIAPALQSVEDSYREAVPVSVSEPEPPAQPRETAAMRRAKLAPASTTVASPAKTGPVATLSHVLQSIRAPGGFGDFKDWCEVSGICPTASNWKSIDDVPEDTKAKLLAGDELADFAKKFGGAK